MNETFRLRSAVKYQGMALSALFLAVLVGYWSMLLIDDPAKLGFKGNFSVLRVAWFGSLVFGTMLLLSLYIWIAYYVERFSINGTTISIRSMLQKRQFDVCEITCLHWRPYPAGGSIRFVGSGLKARLDLYGYR